jgi:hypothetical protein
MRAANRPLQPGGIPAKNVKIPKNLVGERREPEGNLGEAEWTSAGASCRPKRSRGGISHQIFRLDKGVFGGLQEDVARMEVLANESNVLVVGGLPQPHIAS